MDVVVSMQAARDRVITAAKRWRSLPGDYEAERQLREAVLELEALEHQVALIAAATGQRS